MNFLMSLLLACSNGWASAFNVEDVGVFLRSVPPRACPPNELWSTCPGRCSDCDRSHSCFDTQCREDGCDCIPHFVRLKPDGPCVPVSQCPTPSCGETEVFRECGPACERCGALRCRLISCDHRCYCKEGHLRDEEGQCVPKEQCPQRSTCHRHEEWSESGPLDEYCLREEGVGNRTQNVPGCYCKDGFKRNTFGSCVSSCAFVKCYGSAVYRRCVPKCNATCHSDPDCEEDGQCYPGCFCAPGHVMNDFNNCVPRQECPTDSPEVKIVRGPGILLEETTSGVESTPAGSFSSDMEGSFEDGPGHKTEDVGQTEADRQTDATTPSGLREDFANEDV